MDRRSVLKGLAIAGVGLAALPGSATAQKKKKKEGQINPRQIVGQWSLVSNENVKADGTRTQIFGANPSGVAIFAPNKRFSVSLVNPNLPKFASNNRDTGSEDENKSVVRGSLTYFGTYSLAPDGTLSIEIEGSSFPNWNHVNQTRMVTALTATELKWTNPVASIGGTAEVAWKRVK
jgi:Lipocalin-like domain